MTSDEKKLRPFPHTGPIGMRPDGTLNIVNIGDPPFRPKLNEPFDLSKPEDRKMKEQIEFLHRLDEEGRRRDREREAQRTKEEQAAKKPK